MIRSLALGGLLVAAACGGAKKVVEPTAGTLTVAYSGPSNSDGAILLRVNGAVEEVTAVGSYKVSSAPAGAATRVVVTGAIAPGDLVRVRVKDISLNYTAAIEAVADLNTFALGDPTSYITTVRK